MVMIIAILCVDFCVAAAVPHFKALMALADEHQQESELASSDSSHNETGDHPRAQRTDRVVVNYGPAKAKCVHEIFCVVIAHFLVHLEQ